MRNNFEEQLGNIGQQGAQEIAGQASAAQGQLSFVIPTELVELPSQGKFYSPNHPLHNKTAIEIRQMTAKEEDILTNKSFIRKGVVIDKLIESLLVDKSIPVSSILVGDKNAIMVAARISAYGANYDVVVGCTECNGKNTINVDLGQLKVRNFDVIERDAATNEKLQHTRSQTGTVLIKLPKSGWVAGCKLLNGEDERRLLSLIEFKRKSNTTDAEVTLSEQLVTIVESINGETDKETLLKAISFMPAFDAKHLRNVYAKLVPNVTIEKNFTCSSCLGEQELEVPFTQEFFWPK